MESKVAPVGLMSLSSRDSSHSPKSDHMKHRRLVEWDMITSGLVFVKAACWTCPTLGMESFRVEDQAEIVVICGKVGRNINS